MNRIAPLTLRRCGASLVQPDRPLLRRDGEIFLDHGLKGAVIGEAAVGDVTQAQNRQAHQRIDEEPANVGDGRRANEPSQSVEYECQQPLLQPVDPGWAADVAKLPTGQNRVQILAIQGSVGGRLLESVDLVAQTLQPRANCRGSRNVLFLFVSSNIALQTFRGDVKLALARTHMPAPGQFAQWLGSGVARAVELLCRRQQSIEFGTIFGSGERSSRARVG